MASHDVIELGSSDDEAEPKPVAKKPKCVPNAMVHIPNATIKVNKDKNRNVPLINQGVIKPNIGVLNKINKRDTHKIRNPIPMNMKIKNTILKNPMSIALPNIVTGKKIGGVKLPPGITVTMKRKNPGGNDVQLNKSIENFKMKKIMLKQQQPISTVEIEDDEPQPSSSKSSPQWYLRPEDEAAELNLQEADDKKPESPKHFEITIEDSPAKLTTEKKLLEIETDGAIMIDDSPMRTPLVKKRQNSGSGSEDEQTSEKLEPKSKKKLKYSNEIDNRNMIEIEVEPIEVNTEYNCNTLSKETKELDNDKNEVRKTETPKPPKSPISDDAEVIEIDVSPVKSKKLDNNIVTPIKTSMKEEKPQKAVVESEFHPMYQTFIDLCFELENSDDMSKIVERKVKNYYRQLPKDYVESEEFVELVSSKVDAMRACPGKMYMYIKDIVDELNVQRKMLKGKKLEEIKEQPVAEEESEQDVRRRRQIRKMEKTLKKLHRAIQKLEDQEVDFDDDGDSVYVLTERYKERLVRVHAKLCQLSNVKMPSEPRIHIESRPGQPTGPAKKLEKWINRKVPIGTPLPFPDYHDVLRCVKEANIEDRLLWSEAEVREEAVDLFTRCGKKLQRRRQENEWRIAASRISAEAEPLNETEELKIRLAENKKIAAQREEDVIKKYAERQNQLKLEAEEIDDKEAEESPNESDEELLNDEIDDNTNNKNNIEHTKENSDQSDDNITTNKYKETSAESKIVIEKTEASTKETSEMSDSVKDIIGNVNEEETCTEINSQNENDSPEENKEKEADHVMEIDDDSNESVGSDVDELHLLQKLNSKVDNDSSIESSDSERRTSVSDSLNSRDNEDEISSGDVVSIEDSSSSDKEDNDADDEDFENEELYREYDTKLTGDILEGTKEFDKTVKSSNGKNDIGKNEDDFVNLKEDSISIGETVIEGVTDDKQSNDSPNTEDILSITTECDDNKTTPSEKENEVENIENGNEEAGDVIMCSSNNVISDKIKDITESDKKEVSKIGNNNSASDTSEKHLINSVKENDK